MLALKRQDEGQEIDRERSNPEKRVDRDLLRNLICGRQQKRRCAGGKAQPEQNFPDAGPRSGVSFSASRRRRDGAHAPRCRAAQYGECDVQPRPDPALRPQPHEWLYRKRVAEQSQERSEIRERVESPRGFLRLCAAEPALQQWRCGGKQEIRHADGGRQQNQNSKGRVAGCDRLPQFRSWRGG